MRYLQRLWCLIAHRAYHPTDIRGERMDCGTDAGWSDYRASKGMHR